MILLTWHSCKKINHLEVALSITGSDELSLSSEKSIPSSSSPTASVGVSSSDVLSEALTLPPPKPPKTKRKTAVNSKAVSITDEVLQEMQTKEAKKHEAEQEITTMKLEREKRQERELMKAKKEEQKKQKAREREEKESESSYFQAENQRKLLMYLQTYH